MNTDPYDGLSAAQWLELERFVKAANNVVFAQKNNLSVEKAVDALIEAQPRSDQFWFMLGATLCAHRLKIPLPDEKGS